MVLYDGREGLKIQVTNKHYYPEEHNGICVIRREGELTEDLIRRFRKKHSKSGITKELRERMYFEKPSQKRRRKRSQAIRMIKREEEKIKAMKEKARKQKLKRRRREKDDRRSSKRQSNNEKTYKEKVRRRDNNS